MARVLLLAGLAWFGPLCLVSAQMSNSPVPKPQMIDAESVVQYLEGACDLQSGADWTAIVFGQRLMLDTVVRLGPGALLVLDNAGQTLTLGRAGSYKVADVLRDSRAVAAHNLGSIINKKIDLVVRGKPKTVAAVGGVRAGAMEQDSNMIWADSQPPAMRLEAAKKSMEIHDIRGARQSLDAAVFESLPEERDDLIYMIGIDCADAGFPALAIGYVAKHTVPATSPRYEDFVLLKSRILYESLNYDEAVAFCQSIGLAGLDIKSQQVLGMVEALSDRALGKDDLANQRLDSAIAVSPDTDEAKVAEKLRAGP